MNGGCPFCGEPLIGHSGFDMAAWNKPDVWIELRCKPWFKRTFGKRYGKLWRLAYKFYSWCDRDV